MLLLVVVHVVVELLGVVAPVRIDPIVVFLPSLQVGGKGGV